MTIAYLFRHSGTGHSIESLFSSLRREAEQQPDITAKSIQLPFISQGLRSIWQNLRFVAMSTADVFHITGDVHYAVLALPVTRTVLTIHDCSTLKNNRNRPLRYAFFWLFWYYLPIRLATLVTVISEKTRQELIQYVGAIAEKAIVIPNSYDPTFVYKPASSRQRVPILLQIGTAPHKNLPTLFAAIEGLDCLLVLVGPLTATLLNDLRQRRINYRNYVDLSREEIIQCYVDCDIVTFVSTYEGFGMPILEANAIGRPVITSNLSPLCDVAGEAAHWADPNDVIAIRQGILRLIHNAAYRQTLIDAGLENARQYTSKTIAERYVFLYRQLHQSQSESVL